MPDERVQAEVFLVRGMATLSMDGPGQGELGFSLPIRPDYEVAVAAMLDAVSGRDDLDLSRVGAVRDVAARIDQPALFVTGGQDRIVPWQQTERAAREAPRAGFRLFEDGSHVCSNIPYRYRPLVGDWMADQLAAA